MGNFLTVPTTPPLDALFDNAAWVKEHETHLYPNDPQRTFEYVRINHPFCGCAFSISNFPPPHKIPKDRDILAKYADAVTICCVEILGYGLASLPPETNLTGFANTAYVAKHHSDETVRERCEKLLADVLK